MTNLVLYENNDFLIANKPHNIPTVPLKGQDTDGTLLGLLLQDHKEIGEVTGRNSWEYGTIHRLDTPTSGLVLFAKNTRFYNYMLDTQSQNRFLKTYIATVQSSSRLQGHDEIPNDNKYYTIRTYFRSYGPGSKEVRPTLDKKRADLPVLYGTQIVRNNNLCQCTIAKGFRHQIRSHLAWCGLPIVGDSTYGIENSTTPLMLDCVYVTFPLENGRLFEFSKEG